MKLITKALAGACLMADVRSRCVATLAALAFLGSVPLICRADTISSSVTVPLTNSSFSDVSLSSIQLFNAPGTLTGVLISVASNGAINGTVKNTALSNATFALSVDAEMLLDSTIGTIDSLLTGVDYGDLTGVQSYTNLAAGATANYGPFSPFLFQSHSFSSGLTPFSGVGSLGLELSSSTTTTLTGGGGAISSNIQTQAGATVTVTYTYTPASTTPEPAAFSFVLLGGAFLIGKGWSTARKIRRYRTRRVS